MRNFALTSLLVLTMVSPAFAIGESTAANTTIKTNNQNNSSDSISNQATNIVDNTLLNSALADPHSFASQTKPSDNKLVIANQKLLTKNAELERTANDLQTQVNVLVNERGGQLFMYGVFTVIGGILMGVLVTSFLMSRRERW